MRRRPSRRALFGSAALLATLPAMARAHGPDRDLVAVCGAFIATCERYEALESSCPDPRTGRREAAGIWADWDHQLAAMDRLRASTPEGIQARALALHHHVRGRCLTLDNPGTPAGRLLSYLLRDAAALGGAR